MGAEVRHPRLRCHVRLYIFIYNNNTVNLSMNPISERASFQQLLTFLKTALWGCPLPEDITADTVRWRPLMHHASQQTVAALVADVILSNADRLQPPAEVSAWAERQISSARQGNLRLNLTVRDIVTHLRTHGVPAILIKGQGVALTYPQPRLRQCGDIDLYIPPTHYEEAVRLMTTLAGTGGREDEKHCVVYYHAIGIELHYRVLILPMPWQDRAFARWTAESLDGDLPVRVPFNDVEVLLPPADFNAVYLFAHGWHHFMVGGVGLRQLCDWARHLHVHVHASELQLSALEPRLRRFGLWTAWRVWAALAVDFLGLPPEECPGYDSRFHDRAERALAHIIHEGNFGQYNPDRTERPKGYLAGKWHTYSYFLSRTQTLMRIDPKFVLQTIPGYFTTGIRAIVFKDRLGTQRGMNR